MWRDVVDTEESMRPEDSHGAISNCWEVCTQGITNYMGSFIVQRVLETSLFDNSHKGVLEFNLEGLLDWGHQLGCSIGFVS